MTREAVIRCSGTVDEVMKRMQEGAPLVVFDLETTGLKKEIDRILSFSAMKLIKTEDGFKEIDRIDQFIDPEMDIPENVTEINHISAETVAGCPTEDEAAVIIRRFFGENPIVAGYNSRSFDEGFVNAMYLRIFGETFMPAVHLDVYLMAKEKLNLPKHKLFMVAHELGADVGIEFHNSIDDVIATFRCMVVLLDMYRPTRIPIVKKCVSVVSAKRWTKSHELDRIYVQTRPYTKTYYDVYKKVWVSDMDDLDFDDLKEQIFRQKNCTENTMTKVIA